MAKPAKLAKTDKGTAMTYDAPPRPVSNGMGTSALVLGIVGLLLAWIPIIGFLGFLTGALAVVLGGVGMYKARHGTATNFPMASVGTGLGALAVIVSTTVFGGVVSSVDQEMQSSGTGTDSAPMVPAEGGSGGGETVNLAFGQTHSWPGGETITLSQPQEQTPENPYLAPDGRLVAVDVTVRNDGSDEYQVMETKLTAQHNGRVAQQDYLSGDPLPDVQLPPGGETTFTTVYEVGAEPGELKISVQPNYFAEQTVYFTGQF